MLNDFITNKLPDFGANNKEISAEEKEQLKAILQRDFFISPMDKIDDFEESHGSMSH